MPRSGIAGQKAVWALTAGYVFEKLIVSWKLQVELDFLA